MSHRCKVLLADDHEVVLEGLRLMLQHSGCEVVGAVQDGRALVDAAARLHPEVIVADFSMPLLNGVEAARQILKRDPKAKILFLTMHPEVIYAVEAIKAGAAGYLVKDADQEELLTAIRKVRDGGSYITPSLAQPVAEALRSPRKGALADANGLTIRQREVLQLISEGKAAKEIAAILGVSARTVEFHKYRIMNTLGLRTLPELAVYAAKSGLVP